MKVGDGERLVFALDAESKARFWPYFAHSDISRLEHQWVDISPRTTGEWEELLLAIRPTILVTGWGTPSVPESIARDLESPLRYVCHLAGSVRRIVPRTLIARGTTVSNWGQSISFCIAEHAVLLVLGALRLVSSWNAYMSQWPLQTTWNHLPLETRSLRGKRVGLHGFGSIARELVQRLRPFGVELAAYSFGVPAGLFEEYQVRCCGSLEELFSSSDVLIECEALTPHNKGSVDAHVLGCLPDGAVFVNVGRGEVVDETALVQIASEKNLRLGIDVYHEEPLPAHSPLLGCANTLLSPHVAGPTQDALVALYEFASANIRRYLHGQPVEAVVTLEIYDRST